MEMNNRLTKLVFNILSIMLALLFIFPLVWMIVSAMKPEAAIFNDMGTLNSFLPSQHISDWFQSYKTIFDRFDIIKYLGNSILYASAVTIGSILINASAGFAFATIDFKFKKVLFGLMIALLVIPVETIMITKFVVVQRLNLINTPFAVILPLLSTPLYIYMFTVFFRAVSKEIQEAAMIEGANKLDIFLKVMLPMSKPAIATVGTLSFIMSWNDYIWPLMVITNSDRYPLQVAITNINNTEPVYINQIMAILTISTIPLIIIYVFFQKYLVQGMGASGTGEK